MEKNDSQNSSKKKHVVTLAGMLGSGKSTTNRMLSERLGYPSYSAGDFFREYAKEKGMSVLELNQFGERGEDLDRLIDEKQRDFMKNHDNFVIDSRLGFHWAPEAFNVFLDLPVELGVDRILEDMKTNEKRAVEYSHNKEELLTSTKARIASETKRYRDYYGIENNMDPANFDLVVDTEHNNPEQVVQIIIDAYEAWLGEDEATQ